MGYAYATTPSPIMHAAKSLPERKLIATNPIATLRVTVETSSSGTPTNSDFDQTARPVNVQKKSEDSTSNNIDAADVKKRPESTTIRSDEMDEKVETTTSVTQAVRKISDEVSKIGVSGNAEVYEGQSFLSMNDWLDRFRTTSQHTQPQINSDYSKMSRGLKKL